MKQLQHGGSVSLKVTCLGNLPGTVGVVFNEYDLGNRQGVQIMFENGNYDGFSEEEVEEFCEIISAEPFFKQPRIPPFKNVMVTADRYNNGYFRPVFNCIKKNRDW